MAENSGRQFGLNLKSKSAIKFMNLFKFMSVVLHAHILLIYTANQKFAQPLKRRKTPLPFHMFKHFGLFLSVVLSCSWDGNFAETCQPSPQALASCSLNLSIKPHAQDNSPWKKKCKKNTLPVVHIHLCIICSIRIMYSYLEVMF